MCALTFISVSLRFNLQNKYNFYFRGLNIISLKGRLKNFFFFYDIQRILQSKEIMPQTFA